MESVLFNATEVAFRNEDNINYRNRFAFDSIPSKGISFKNYSDPYILLETVGKTIKGYRFSGNGIITIIFTDGTSIDIGLNEVESIKFNNKESECQ